MLIVLFPITAQPLHAKGFGFRRAQQDDRCGDRTNQQPPLMFKMEGQPAVQAKGAERF